MRGILCLFFLALGMDLQARVILTHVTNHSETQFLAIEGDIRSCRNGILIDQGGASLTSEDGQIRLVFKDQGQVRERTPYWRFSVHVEKSEGIPNGLVSTHFADIDYDGDGQFSLAIDEYGRLSISGGRDVSCIYYSRSER